MKLTFARIAFLVLCVQLCAGCGPWVTYAGKGKWAKPVIQSSIFSQGNTGFALYDLEKEKWLADYQGNKKFTPASNTKLLTILAARQVLGEELAVIKYLEKSDRIILQPTGFPGFNYLNKKGSAALDSLLKIINKPVKLLMPSSLAPYGSGWAWDDSGYSYQVPRSWVPIYGNRLTKNESHPNLFFADSILINTTDFSDFNNQFIQGQAAKGKNSIPFFPNNNFIAKHLWPNGNLEVIELKTINQYNNEKFKDLRIPAFPFYEAVLKDSDNFIAEQLLIMMNEKKPPSDIGNSFTKSYFDAQFKDEKMAWVDGSGLSRYNALSPRQIVKVLQLLIKECGLETTTKMLPEAGAEGTLQGHYKTIPGGHLFAKTGTLRHVHCLSGVLFTQSGKPLIFSFMNNQIPGSNALWKSEMEKQLLKIYEKY